MARGVDMELALDIINGFIFAVIPDKTPRTRKQISVIRSQCQHITASTDYVAHKELPSDLSFP